MKQHANKGRSDRQYEAGDLVYVKLQLYRWSTVVNRKNLKLSMKYFGIYRVLDRIGAVAYRLELPAESRIHLVFHVSHLKLHVGLVVQHTQLPLLTEDNLLAKEPVAVLDQRIAKRRGMAVTEVLIQWKN